MFSIVKNWKIFFAITISFLIIGVGSILFRGFNLGIDFTGGSIMDLSFNKAVTVAEVRDVLKEHKLGNAIIQLENVVRLWLTLVTSWANSKFNVLNK